MASSSPSKLKDPQTCRVFFSSPFRGMEEERNELTRKYFPQIHHLCNSRGIQFVPVDMRWGITSEAAENAQTVNICLRELDRCDIFVGFYAQRYGWHGADDKKLQQNFDNAVGLYPWLNEFRDRSATELEFLHGHLNNPGALPACFCFRDKSYDAEKLEVYEKEGDTNTASKYRCESDEAKQKLNHLRNKIYDTRDKTLSVFMDYENPEEGAKHIFDTLWNHLNSFLTGMSEEIPEREKELAEHDAFMASHQALYIGGDRYFRLLDSALKADETETGMILVTGQAGQGKSALLANWVPHVKQLWPDALLAYHFVGSSKESGKAGNVLRRLLWEVSGKTKDGETSLEKKADNNDDADKNSNEKEENATSEKKLESKTAEEKDGKKTEEKKMTVYELMNELQSELEGRKEQVILVVDGIDKLESQKITKPVFWLSKKFPSNVKVVVSTLDTDSVSIEELTSVRNYRKVELEDLDLEHRTQICLKTLEKSGKALSQEQLQRVVDKEQTKNPLYLKIIMAELSVFGYFRKLDEKIDTLLTANSVGELFVKLLERLEMDYNMEEQPDLVQQVLMMLCVSREGFSEADLIEILDVPSHLWSPLYFALEQFVVVHSGLIRFAFSELSDAVKERYLMAPGAREGVMKFLINKLDEKRKTFTLWPKTPTSVSKNTATELPWLQKDVGDIDGLITSLSDLVVFNNYIINNEYDLLELWKSTGKLFSDIADIYIASFDQALVDIYCLEKDKLYKKEDETKPPGQRILSYLENVRFFMDLASCTAGCRKIVTRIIALLENLENVYKDEKDRLQLLAENRYYLACNYSDENCFQQAEELHLKVMDYWKEGLAKGEVEEKLAETRIAWIFNGLGLNRLRDRKYIEAEEYFEKCLQYHIKHDNKRNKSDSIMNRGLARLRQGRLIEAKSDMLETLQILEEIYFGQLPHEIGNLYTNLGLIYRRLKQLDEAEKYYFKSLEIKAKAVGWDHLIVATCYMNLGTLEMHRKNWEKAEEYTYKALDIYKINQVGDDIIEYRHCRENMANCKLRQEKFKEGEPFYWSVFEVLTRLGKMSECLPWVHNTMGRHYVNTGQYEKAEKILTAMANCPERRKPDTYVCLEDLYKLHPRPHEQPAETSLEFALDLWPNNLELLKLKIQRDFLPTIDIDGLMNFLTEKMLPVLTVITLFTFIQQQNKPGMTLAVMEKLLQKFPNNYTLKTMALQLFYEEKQFEKALPIALDLTGTHSANIAQARILIWAGKTEEAKTAIQPLIHSMKNGLTQSSEVVELMAELGVTRETEEKSEEQENTEISSTEDSRNNKDIDVKV